MPIENPERFNEHILCQMLDTCKFLFFISFLKIEYDKEPNFAAEFEHMVKNCSNSIRKAALEIGLAGSRLNHKPVGNQGTPWFRNARVQRLVSDCSSP